jgi:hypothetical protein
MRLNRFFTNKIEVSCKFPTSRLSCTTYGHLNSGSTTTTTTTNKQTTRLIHLASPILELKTEQNPLATYHPCLNLHPQNTNGKHIVVALLLLLPPPPFLQPFLNIVIPSQSPKNYARENAAKQKL